MNREAISRVRAMEALFDKLNGADPHAVTTTPSLRTYYRHLLHYYENGQWMQDFLLEEKGYFPKNLKRGILSEDAVYDLICRVKMIVAACLLVKTLGGDPIQTAQLYSKEIENNTDNIDAILDAAYTHPLFTDENLLGLLIES